MKMMMMLLRKQITPAAFRGTPWELRFVGKNRRATRLLSSSIKAGSNAVHRRLTLSSDDIAMRYARSCGYSWPNNVVGKKAVPLSGERSK